MGNRQIADPSNIVGNRSHGAPIIPIHTTVGSHIMQHPGTRKGKDLADRLGRYAALVIRIAMPLPATKIGRHLQDQLMRSATAPGAHYAESRSAQSTADFIHKVGLAAKEARESVHWLRTCMHVGFIEYDVPTVIDEGEQLAAILTASLNTARRNSREST